MKQHKSDISNTQKHRKWDQVFLTLTGKSTLQVYMLKVLKSELLCIIPHPYKHECSCHYITRRVPCTCHVWRLGWLSIRNTCTLFLLFWVKFLFILNKTVNIFKTAEDLIGLLLILSINWKTLLIRLESFDLNWQ